MATRSKMKSQYRKENADRRPHATAKHIRISSRKVKIVIDLIRGKSVEDAEAILMYTPKAASEPTLKVLRSAIANAVNNLDMDKETLYVAECFANQGWRWTCLWRKSAAAGSLLWSRTRLTRCSAAL